MIDALRVGVAPATLLARRKTEFAAEAKLSLPFLIDAAAVETLGQPAKVSGADVMDAFAVSAGVAKGEARIVKSPAQAGDLGRGYVLVCPSTDPNWTPLFVNAAGLVLECGGTLSHGAVVAGDEPAGGRFAGATMRVSSGEVITVDGNGGAVIRGDGEGRVGGDRGNDLKVSPLVKPPVEGKRERKAGRLRNWFALGWGVYLLAAWVLPERWVYGPTMKVLDSAPWPLVRGLGKPLTVVVIAAGMALLTMVMQRWMTDNVRLKEAKRRAKQLQQEAQGLPENSPRRRMLEALARPVQGRIAAAVLLPIRAAAGADGDGVPVAAKPGGCCGVECGAGDDSGDRREGTRYAESRRAFGRRARWR